MTSYPFTPSRITNVQTEYKTNITQFENGVEQRSPAWVKPKKTFAISQKYLNPTSLATLEEFFDSCRGSYSPFTFDNYLDGKTYTVRFKDDIFNVERINSFFCDVNFEVIEC